jgi:hypothetical protein
MQRCDFILEVGTAAGSACSALAIRSSPLARTVWRWLAASAFFALTSAPAAAQDCPTAASGKGGFVVERGDQQKSEVFHVGDGTIRYRHALQWHHGPGDDAARGTVSTRSAGQRPENEIRAPIRSEEALPSQARVQCRRKIHLRKQRSAGHSVGRLGGKRGGRSLYRSVQIQRAEDRAQRIAHSPNLRVSSIPITILRS